MYVSKKPYSEQIRIPTDKNQDDQIDKKHSEFKKPYLSDTYEEMEYFADAPIGYAFMPGAIDGVNVDVPWMGTPVPDWPKNPMYIAKVFRCDSGPCWCENQTKCFSAFCTNEIIKAMFTTKGYSKWGFTFSGNEFCITAPDGASGSPSVAFFMRHPIQQPDGSMGFREGSYIIIIPKCKDKECCAADAAMAWNDDGSDDTVVREESANIGITGTNTPFSWSVSGTGFSLEYSTTEGLGNTLYADASACGKATITVTGCDDVSVTGYVACTTGVWSSAAETYCYECESGGSALGWFYDWQAPLYRYYVNQICDTPAWCTGTPACSDMGLPKFISLKAECLAEYGGARHSRGWSTIQPWACS